jgi:flagellar hook-length control protein FliK
MAKRPRGAKRASAAERAALLSKVPTAALSEQGENDTGIQLEAPTRGPSLWCRPWRARKSR